MPTLLQRAIAREMQGPCPVIDATHDLTEQARDSVAIAACRPLALAILAWCQEHPAEVGEHAELVSDLRHALAMKAMMHDQILAIWVAIPETVDVRASRPHGR